MKGDVTVTPITQDNGTTFPGAGFVTAGQKTSYVGTLRGRAGVALGKVFIYGTAGLAYGHVRFTADSDFRPVGTVHYPADLTKTKTGAVGGVGGEFGLTKHISWKLEYLYYDLRKESATENPSTPLPPFQVRYNWQTRANTFNAGINVRF